MPEKAPSSKFALKYKVKPRLGILGGMGPLATSVFYQRLTTRSNQYAECDQDHIDCFIWSDCSMPDRTQAILNEKSEELLARCKEAFLLLQEAGCDAVCFPCNTLHHFFEELRSVSPLPLLNMVELCIREIKKNYPLVRCLHILGTDGTRQSAIYEKYARQYGFDVLPVDDDEQTKLSQYIYELKNTGRTDFPGLSRLILKAQKKGADLIVLACTELSCMNLSHDASVLVFDAMDALVSECIRRFGPDRK